MTISNQYIVYGIIGVSFIFAFMAIVSLIKKPKFLSRFEAFWTCLVLSSEIGFTGYCVYSVQPVLEVIFLGISIFLLWIIILFLFRRPKFDHRGAVIITCFLGIVLYLGLFYITHLNIVP